MIIAADFSAARVQSLQLHRDFISKVSEYVDSLKILPISRSVSVHLHTHGPFLITESLASQVSISFLADEPEENDDKALAGLP
jgi:dihydroxyacetone kinase-like predicted kinase